MDIRFSYFWSESFGQIYPQLKKLNEDGLIEEVVSEKLENNRESKKYSITDTGIYELKKWLEEPVENEVVRYEILLKMYFSNNTSPEIMLGHIKEFQVAHSQQQKLFEKCQCQLEKIKNVHENHEDILMVISFGYHG